ncbi:hypothetical protein PR002_g14360 [Phytophthora rubi]|uniref:Uncharacterized protein n=1 Tax=Phytophthora rubi TaxID=129364 RepID=A0A6A3L779_9STRA|nr:hypothetical protein PR002_g14360 [Phytophthora rubi]
MGTHEASGSIALEPTASRKRTKKATEPATRRSARIRERTERHVHWATAAPDTGQPAARTVPRAAPDANGTPPSAGRGTATTTTTRATLPDITPNVQDASAAVESRTMTTETAGAPATASTAPAAVTPAPRASGSPAPRPAATRGARREVTAPPTHGEKTATMQEAPAVSTKEVKEKRSTKGATKVNTTKETTVTAGVAPTTQDMTNHAVVMQNGADDLGKDDEDAPVGDTLQLSDDELMVAQKLSKFVKRLLADDRYGSMKVETKFGLVTIETRCMDLCGAGASAALTRREASRLEPACKGVDFSPLNETAVTAETTDGGVAVHGRVGRESSGPRDRQDRQHDEIRTSGSPDPTNAASSASSANSSSLTIWPANEQAGQLQQHARGSECKTNERQADEAWLDVITDSVDDYTAVDDGGVTDRKHVASESLDGCDQ